MNELYVSAYRSDAIAMYTEEFGIDFGWNDQLNWMFDETIPIEGVTEIGQFQGDEGNYFRIYGRNLLFVPERKRVAVYRLLG